MPIPTSGWFVHAIAHPHLVRNCLPPRTCGWGLLPIFICTANNCYYLGSQSQRIGPVLATTKSQILRRIWELGPHLQGWSPICTQKPPRAVMILSKNFIAEVAHSSSSA
jgi:hypothetical protein